MIRTCVSYYHPFDYLEPLRGQEPKMRRTKMNIQNRPCIRCNHANRHHSSTGRCQVVRYFFQCVCQH